MDENKTISIILFASVLLLLIGFFLWLVFVTQRIRTNKLLLEKKMMKENLEKQLLQSKIETQEETMSILGKELHDNIGQLLNTTKLLIGVSQRTVAEPPDTLIIADETLGQAIHELRALSKSLNKEWLEKFDFTENIQMETNRLNAAGAMQIYFDYKDQLPLKSSEQIMLFRVVQEALQNAIKHARAQRVVMDVWIEQDNLMLTVADDGLGFDHDKVMLNGVGMLNMKHRVQLLGGSINWQQRGTNKATIVTIQIPVKSIEL